MEVKRLILLLNIFALAVLMQSCDYLQPRQPEADAEKIPLARVDDRYLYLEDIQSIFRDDYNTQDSLMLLNNYVESWIRNQLAIQAARQNLPQEIPEIEHQVSDYRESLYMHLYETEIVKQKLDTVILADEIEEYYESYTQNFKLHHDIVMLKFLKLDEATPNVEQASAWLNRFDSDSRQSLHEYSMQYAIEFTFEENFWLSVAKAKQILPVNADDLKALARRNVVETVEDEGYLYLLKVEGYKSQGEIAPIEYVSDKISKIILNRRKHSLISDTYNKLYQEALKGRIFERFDK